MGLDLGGIEFYAGPSVLGAPDDLEQLVKDFVAGAKKSLLFAVQELDSRPVAEAILAGDPCGGSVVGGPVVAQRGERGTTG